jgi:hypothetical protein
MRITSTVRYTVYTAETCNYNTCKDFETKILEEYLKGNVSHEDFCKLYNNLFDDHNAEIIIILKKYLGYFQ